MYDSATITDDTYNPLINLDLFNEKGRTVVREAYEKRTKNSKHFLMSDGSYKAVITKEDLNYIDENGKWQTIAPQLVEEGQSLLSNLNEQTNNSIDPGLVSSSLLSSTNKDKKRPFFRVKQVPYDAIIWRDYSKGYSIKKEGDNLTFVPVGARSVVGSVYSNNVIMFEDAWHAVDVELKLLNTGIKETLILKDASASSNFSFEITGAISSDLKTNQLVLWPAWLIDANGVTRDVSQTLRTQGKKKFIDLKANLEGLKFPIYVDPTVTIVSNDTNTKDAFVNSSTLVQGNGDSFYITRGTVPQRERAMLQFDLSSIRSDSSISSAEIQLYRHCCNFVSSEPISLYRITQPWDENVVWANQPAHDPGSSAVTYVSDTRWYSWNVTSWVQQWVAGSYVNNGVKMIGEIINGSDGRFGFYSSEYYNASYRPKLIVTYNEPTSIPTVLTPTSSTLVDGVTNIAWTAAVDSETTQNLIKYQVQLSTNNGASWSDLVALTNPGQTSFTFDFTNTAETNTAYIRVRGYDGGMYGGWGQSQLFSIKHNHAPNIPSNLSPGGASSATARLVGSTTPTLAWTFSDPDVGNIQSAYNVVIKDASGSTPIYDSGWVPSTSNTFTVPAGKLVRNTTYAWQVGLKDNKGDISPYSALSYIKINNIPTVTLTKYSDNQSISDNILTFTWSYADQDGQPQQKYQVLGTQNDWATVSYNSGEVTSPSASHTTPALASGVWSFKVLVSDGMEWSSGAARNKLTLPNAYEPNDTNAQAFTISPQQIYDSLITSATDIDFFKFTAATSGINQILLIVPAGLNYDAHIFDSNMNLVATGSKGAGLFEYVLFEVMAGKSYYIKIFGVGGNFSNSATYSLILKNVTIQQQTTYQYDANGNIISKQVSQSK
ncbi:DNRLRE domain-containing protein [Paenibacillus chartarius]|uniref:DNRLRE domain-containing protein n=1 Tax=Paenibacillus chartarius TaxID=747481 RepID=A0ABV6DEQ6_9BACL